MWCRTGADVLRIKETGAGAVRARASEKLLQGGAILMRGISIRVIRLNDGAVFESAGQAAKAAGVSTSSVTRAMERGTDCKGVFYAEAPERLPEGREMLQMWCQSKIFEINVKAMKGSV